MSWKELTKRLMRRRRNISLVFMSTNLIIPGETWSWPIWNAGSRISWTPTFCKVATQALQVKGLPQKMMRIKSSKKNSQVLLGPLSLFISIQHIWQVANSTLELIWITRCIYSLVFLNTEMKTSSPSRSPQRQPEEQRTSEKAKRSLSRRVNLFSTIGSKMMPR